MGIKEQFYEDYDNTIVQICEPYREFLSIAAGAIPKNFKSVCDLGIGTGNFSVEVQKEIPNVKLYGIDRDKNSIEKALKKIRDLKAYNRDFFSEPLPNVDYFISSLATHHFDSSTRIEKLTQIANGAKGFINFDLMLFDGNDFEDVIKLVLSFARKNFPNQDLSDIENEMRTNDNPMQLKEIKDVFEPLGFKFEILAKRAPWAVYKVSKPE